MHRFAKHVGENLAPTMLRSDPRQTEFVDFLSPFGNTLENEKNNSEPWSDEERMILTCALSQNKNVLKTTFLDIVNIKPMINHSICW